MYVSRVSPRRAAQALLALALCQACGERAVDPIVALADGSADAGASPGTQPDPPGDGGSGGSDTEPPTAPQVAGPIGLCGACTSSDECGDANDACIGYLGRRFCGRDCDEQLGCPDGYLCVELSNTPLYQCVPETTCPVPSATPSLVDIRAYVFDRVNALRADRDRAPLVASSCLDQLAQDSALAYARSDEPLGKYVEECDPIWPNCACGWSGEAELSVSRYGLDWTTAVDQAVVPYPGQNDRFIQAVLSTQVSGVGVGFWLSGDEAWIALSFR